MDLTPILARLEDQLMGQPGGFKKIGGAADIEAIGNGVVPTPACFVVPMTESADDNATFGQFEQRVTVGFSVVLAASNRRDATGAAALAGLEPLRRQIKAAIVGWAPEADFGEPVHFSGGSLLSFADGLLWWADEFRVVTYERSSA